jgi:endonuclease/exonuclease/phosphatase family metal-dependent hydrolase
MFKFLKSATTAFLLMLNILLAILFIACCFAPYLDPREWWFTGFFGLFFPYLFLLMLFFLVGWLFVRPKWALIPAIVLLIGIIPLSSHVSFKSQDSFSVERGSELRVMTWNVRNFIPFDETEFIPSLKEHHQLIFEQIKKYQPDVISFQEFLSIPWLGEFDPFLILKNELGYKYVKFAGDEIFKTEQRSGIAIFSKIPLVGSGVIEYSESPENKPENTVYVDLKYKEDTIRLYSIHLQSFRFGDREYKAINDLRHESKIDVGESKHVLRRMKNTFYWHGVQADFMKSMMDKSPHPVVLTGDFNDVPNSYAYSTLKGDLNDVFLEKGSGIGATFTSATSSILRHLPTLRIDYIFADPTITSTQFLKGGKKISDHAFLISDFTTKQ